MIRAALSIAAVLILIAPLRAVASTSDITDAVDDHAGTHRPPPHEKGSGVYVVELKWSFDWSATAQSGGRCQCLGVEWGEYSTERECQHAFAESQFDSCVYKSHGIERNDCKFAVSTDPSILNNKCVTLCNMMVHAESNREYDAFIKICSFEKYQVTSRGEVLLLSPYCFSNDVYGHSDLSPPKLNDDAVSSAPHIMAHAVDISTASLCQEECQRTPKCSAWIWRAVPDTTTAHSNTGKSVPVLPYRKSNRTGAVTAGTPAGTKSSGYGLRVVRRMSSAPSMTAAAASPTHSCLLKTSAIIDAATQAVLPVGQLALGIYPPYTDPIWEACDVPRKWDNIYRTFTTPEPDDTCTCGCVWQSYKHVSGPKLCGKDQATSLVFAPNGTTNGTDNGTDNDLRVSTTSDEATVQRV